MIHSLSVPHRTKKKRKKKKGKKKTMKNPILGRTDSLGQWISLGLEQQVPVAVHSLSPTAIDEISKIRILWSIFWFYGTNGEAPRSRATSKCSQNSPLSATRSLTRCSHGRARRKEARERNETKRSADRTQLAGAAGPRMPCGPAGSGTFG